MFGRIFPILFLLSSLAHAEFVLKDGKYNVGACEIEVFKNSLHGLYEFRVTTEKGYNGAKRDFAMFNLAIEDGQPVGGLNSCNNGWESSLDAPTYYNMKKEKDDVVIGVSAGNMLKICDAVMGLSVNQKTGKLSKLFFQDQGAYGTPSFHSGPLKQLFNSFRCDDDSDVPSFPWSRNMVAHFISGPHAKQISGYFDYIRDYEKAHPESSPAEKTSPSESDTTR